MQQRRDINYIRLCRHLLWSILARCPPELLEAIVSDLPPDLRDDLRDAAAAWGKPIPGR